MGFLKNLTDKAKEKATEIKKNVSKEDLLNVVTDAQRVLASGNGDMAKIKAFGTLVNGLGKAASGKQQSLQDKLDSLHKDPYDIQMAEETKDAFNEILKQKINGRKFIYDNPAIIENAVSFIVSCMHTIDLLKDPTILPKIKEYMDANNIHYDEKGLEDALNKFMHDKENIQLLAHRDMVDKYIFIDRMTKDEILAIHSKYEYNLQKHYKFQCEYCGRRFETAPRTGLNMSKCEFHPDGPCKGPHKVHSIGQDKLWVD